MKKYLFVIILATLALVQTAYSQTIGSVITFKKAVHDFGTIKEEDGKVTVSFDFANTGKNPLIIQRVITSCDCAVADWPKEPLIPSATGSIKVEFNPKDRPGNFEKLVTVYSNAETSTVVLIIRGFVKERAKTIEDIYNRTLGDLRFKNTHASLGRIFSNEIKSDTIEFISVAKEPVKIGAKIVGLPYLGVRFVPETLKPQEKGLLIVTYNAKIRNDWGFVVDRFYLTQNDKEINGAMINVSASIEENFTALTDAQRASSPIIDLPEPNYEFGTVEEGQLIEKEFVFTNVGKTDLIIRKIKASCGCTTLEPADKIIKPGRTSSFKASVRTNGFSGRIAKSITVITNDPVNPTVVVRLVGNVNSPKKQ